MWRYIRGAVDLLAARHPPGAGDAVHRSARVRDPGRHAGPDRLGGARSGKRAIATLKDLESASQAALPPPSGQTPLLAAILILQFIEEQRETR